MSTAEFNEISDWVGLSLLAIAFALLIIRAFAPPGARPRRSRSVIETVVVGLALLTIAVRFIVMV